MASRFKRLQCGGIMLFVSVVIFVTLVLVALELWGWAIRTR